MFFHMFKYKMKLLLYDKITVFWALIFPIILAIFFNLAFANILKGEAFEKIDIAYVENNTTETVFYDTMKSTDLFNITKASDNYAKELLSTGKISGIIYDDDKPSLKVAKSGVEESIIEEFLNEYSQKKSTITNVIKTSPEALQNGVIDTDNLVKSYTWDENLNGTSNIRVVYFYTIIAMTCLLGSTLGSQDTAFVQADQSSVGAHINVTPVTKVKYFLASICATQLFSFTSVILVILFIQYCLHVSFGNSLINVIILAFVATFTGVTMGTMVSALLPKGERVKDAVLVGLTMFSSFLTGMMSLDVKIWLDSTFPLISHINLASLITDGLASLYYYSNGHRYHQCLLSLCVFAVIFFTITIVVIRRKQYESV